MSEVIAGKLGGMVSCAKRIREVWNMPSDELPIEQDLLKQESVLLNLQHFFADLLDC